MVNNVNYTIHIQYKILGGIFLMVDTKSYIYSLVVYIAILIVPIIIYLKFKEKVKVLTYLKLNTNSKKGIGTALVVCCIFIVMLAVKKAIFSISDTINFDLGILWLSVILVGFLEEIPFRGFLLQKLWNKIGFWKANIVTTAVFVSVHIPTWLNSNTPIVKAAISISFVSLALGYLFREYKSLWVPIICHSVYNLCIWVGL